MIRTNTRIAEASIEEITDVVVDAMQSKKAKDIVSLDLRDLNTRPVEMFLICHGDNDRQVEAIARAVEEAMEIKLGERPWHREGFENKEWILLDYVNVVVHVFLEEKREFYALEELWGDAEFERFQEVS